MARKVVVPVAAAGAVQTTYHFKKAATKSWKNVVLGIAATAILAVVIAVPVAVLTKGNDDTLPENWQAELDSASDFGSATALNLTLVRCRDCDELDNLLKHSIAEEYKTQLIQAANEVYNIGARSFGGATAEMAPTAASADAAPMAKSAPAPAPREEGKDFSGTNNHEDGVDEADFVKTDGFHIYYLQGDSLHILGVPEFGKLALESSMKVEGTPTAMMLDSDTLIVLSSLSSWDVKDPMYKAMQRVDGGRRIQSLTKFTIVDITDRTKPTVTRQLYIEGNYLTAREVNGTIRAVTHARIELPSTVKNYLSLPSSYYELAYDDPERAMVREKVAYTTIQSNTRALEGLQVSELLPKIFEVVVNAGGVETLVTHAGTAQLCRNFNFPIGSFNRGVSSIFSLRLMGTGTAVAGALPFDVDHIVGNYPVVYASESTMVLAENTYDWESEEESTNIHIFDISAAATTRYTGSGRVAGTVLNQFSLSAHGGYVRVASTIGRFARWWRANAADGMFSRVLTLQMHTQAPQVVASDSGSASSARPRGRGLGSSGLGVGTGAGVGILREVGRVDRIAPGERIYSARFVGDRGYVVTFAEMDPLWVIDLSDPAAPRILGELHVPGVSTYIHPLSDRSLLTIGMPPRNATSGLGLDWSQTQISLFNISNPSDPALEQALLLSPVTAAEREQDAKRQSSYRWSAATSEASYEHKAFQYWQPKRLLAVPLSTYRYDGGYDEVSGEWRSTYEYRSLLAIVHVDETTGVLTRRGEVDHKSLYDRDGGTHRWNRYSVRRSIFMGDYVYALGVGGVTATNLNTMAQTAVVQFTLPVPEPMIMAGRPLLSGNGSCLVPEVVWDNDDNSDSSDNNDKIANANANATARAPSAPSASVRFGARFPLPALLTAAHWLHAARMERASVGAFNRFSLELLRVAALEEVGHAELIFDLASTIDALSADAASGGGASSGRRAVRAGEMAELDDAPPTRRDLGAVLLGTYNEGCVAEGKAAETAAAELAAVWAWHQAEAACHHAHTGTVAWECEVAAQIVQVLTVIAEEEAEHAAMAWRTLEWGIARYASTAEAKKALGSDVVKAATEWQMKQLRPLAAALSVSS